MSREYLTISETGTPNGNDFFVLQVIGSPTPTDSVFVPIVSQDPDTCLPDASEVELFPGGSTTPPDGGRVHVLPVDDGVAAGSRDCLITLGPGSSTDSLYDALFPVVSPGNPVDPIATITDGSVTAPFVTNVDTVPGNGNGVLDPGEVVDVAALSGLHVTYDQQMQQIQQPIGGQVTNPSNYLLVRAGGGGSAIRTSSCLAGLDPADEEVDVASVVYDEASRTATWSPSDPTPPDAYRLLVCGTTSVRNLSPLEEKLDGDHDGIAGGDFILDFFVGVDTDGDGTPNQFDSDDDNDGMPDTYEEAHPSVLDPLDPGDASEDPDQDGLDNLGESEVGTDPDRADTDGDGIGDLLDEAPNAPSNACRGDRVQFATEVTSDVTCAASGSIEVVPPASVLAPGSLRLLSPVVVIFDGFGSGDLTIQTTDPCPSC